MTMKIFPNGVTGKKCTAFFIARGVNNPYWMGLGENFWTDIAYANKLTDPTTIQVGDQLTIPIV